MERIVADAVAALNRSDWDAALKDASPDLAFDTSRTLGEWRGFYKGAEDVKRVWREFAAPWVTVRREIDEVIEGEGCAVTRITVYFEGREGIEVKIRTSWVWTVQDGAVTQITVYNDLGDALAAAGLRG
ncbi:MAG: nuclear transport factor 2 family protein [Gammaproteobacteria bacterium]